MKAAIIFGVVTLSLGSLLLWQGEQEDKYCIEQWLANTQDVFSNAMAIFSGASAPSESAPTETEALDEKLQALLPVESSQQINWQYSDTAEDTLSESASEQALLPNLFNRTESAKTKVTGQLHLDEADNIVGAEVNVAIPTN